MKKGLFSFVFALLCMFSFGQTIHKGALLGLHFSASNLKEGVTMEEYTKFYTGKVIPAYEKVFPGIKMFLLKSLRGQDSSSIGLIYMFDSEAVRNKYFNSDGTPTDAFKAGAAKLSDLDKEFAKYEASSSNTPDKYNDWLVL